jgi:hypothetical protein
VWGEKALVIGGPTPRSAVSELGLKPLPHRRHDEIFRLPLRMKHQHPIRHFLRFGEASGSDHGSHSRDLAGRHRQLTNPETQENPGECGISCHVSTYRDGLACARGALDRFLEKTEQRRVERVIKVVDLWILTIGRKSVLDEVVGSDAEEIGVFG